MKLDNRQNVPACQEFFKSEPTDEGTEPAIHFCKSSANPPCWCQPNGLDVECMFRICGYKEGFYQADNLPHFAVAVADEIEIWGDQSLVSTSFMGFADGTLWEREKMAQPQPLSEFVKRCLYQTRGAHKERLKTLEEQDVRDAELALLRGCALEEELAKNIDYFEFGSIPSFSFKTRTPGQNDPDARAAEIRIVVADACGRLASWTDQKKK